MDIEKPVGVVKQHGFHLGTFHATAERILLERLDADAAIVTIALRLGDNIKRIYDFRDRSNFRDVDNWND
jgi:hypothetical protein